MSRSTGSKLIILAVPGMAPPTGGEKSSSLTIGWSTPNGSLFFGMQNPPKNPSIDYVG
jgi:hypothetical protein